MNEEKANSESGKLLDKRLLSTKELSAYIGLLSRLSKTCFTPEGSLSRRQDSAKSCFGTRGSLIGALTDYPRMTAPGKPVDTLFSGRHSWPRKEVISCCLALRKGAYYGCF